MLISRFGAHNGHVLDLACGVGNDVRKCAHTSPRRYTGIDISGASLEVARTRAAQVTFPCDWQHADMCDPALASRLDAGTYNTVSCQFAFHYAFHSAASLDAALNTVATALRPGGYFIATFPDAEVLSARLRVQWLRVHTGAPLDRVLAALEGAGGDVDAAAASLGVVPPPHPLTPAAVAARSGLSNKLCAGDHACWADPAPLTLHEAARLVGDPTRRVGDCADFRSNVWAAAEPPRFPAPAAVFNNLYNFSLAHSSVIGCPEPLAHVPTLVDAAATHGLKLCPISRHPDAPATPLNFVQLFKLFTEPSSFGTARFDGMLDAVLEPQALPTAVWNATHLYCAAVFKRMKN